MTCTTCHSTTTRIRIIKGKETCSSCGNFSEANGTRIDGVLSRQRVRADAMKYEGDVLNPFTYDKITKKAIPNPDFIKLHPQGAKNYFEPKDLKNYPKLADKIVKDRKSVVDEGTGIGDTTQAMKEVIKST